MVIYYSPDNFSPIRVLPCQPQLAILILKTLHIFILINDFVLQFDFSFNSWLFSIFYSKPLETCQHSNSAFFELDTNEAEEKKQLFSLDGFSDFE